MRKLQLQLKLQAVWIVLVMAVLTLGGTSAGAQSFSEWFRQKKTQKKYLLAQIAALESYLKLVEKGYDIAGSGLAVITKLKNGDFMQHALHFNRLKRVSPAVKNYSKVLAIAEMEDRSEQFRRALLSDTSLRALLSARELRSLHRFCEDAGKEAEKNLKYLELLVTGEELEMTDDERISHIDELYERVKKQVHAVLKLGGQVRSLMKARKEGARDYGMLERVYGR